MNKDDIRALYPDEESRLNKEPHMKAKELFPPYPWTVVLVEHYNEAGGLLYRRFKAFNIRTLAEHVERESYEEAFADCGGTERGGDDVLAQHDGGAHRQWWSGGAWLYPGDSIVLRHGHSV